MRKIIIALVACALLVGCASTPTPAVATTKTDAKSVETIVTAKDLESTIEDIKHITDKAKETGVVATSDTPELIKYVDISDNQVKKLNADILALEASRKSDNATSASAIATATGERDAVRALAERRLVWALVATFSAVVMALVLFRRLLK